RGKTAILPGGLAVVLLLVVAAFFVRNAREKARFRALTAGLESAAAAGRLDEAFTLLQEKGLDLGDPRLAGLAGKVGGTPSPTTDPAGAAVTVTRAQPVAGFASRRPLPVGRAPVTARLVAGEYLVRLEADGVNPVAFLQPVEAGKELRISRKLI